MGTPLSVSVSDVGDRRRLRGVQASRDAQIDMQTGMQKGKGTERQMKRGEAGRGYIGGTMISVNTSTHTQTREIRAEEMSDSEHGRKCQKRAGVVYSASEEACRRSRRRLLLYEQAPRAAQLIHHARAQRVWGWCGEFTRQCCAWYCCCCGKMSLGAPTNERDRRREVHTYTYEARSCKTRDVRSNL